MLIDLQYFLGFYTKMVKRNPKGDKQPELCGARLDRYGIFFSEKITFPAGLLGKRRSASNRKCSFDRDKSKGISYLVVSARRSKKHKYINKLHYYFSVIIIKLSTYNFNKVQIMFFHVCYKEY